MPNTIHEGFLIKRLAKDAGKAYRQSFEESYRAHDEAQMVKELRKEGQRHGFDVERAKLSASAAAGQVITEGWRKRRKVTEADARLQVWLDAEVQKLQGKTAPIPRLVEWLDRNEKRVRKG